MQSYTYGSYLKGKAHKKVGCKVRHPRQIGMQGTMLTLLLQNSQLYIFCMMNHIYVNFVNNLTCISVLCKTFDKICIEISLMKAFS